MYGREVKLGGFVTRGKEAGRTAVRGRRKVGEGGRGGGGGDGERDDSGDGGDGLLEYAGGSERGGKVGVAPGMEIPEDKGGAVGGDVDVDMGNDGTAGNGSVVDGDGADISDAGSIAPLGIISPTAS